MTNVKIPKKKKQFQYVFGFNEENNILEFYIAGVADVDVSRKLPPELCSTFGFLTNIAKSETVRDFSENFF